MDIFLPSIVCLIFFVFFSFLSITYEDKYSKNLLILTFMFFYMSFQLFMLGLFSTLRARILGLNKSLWLDTFFRFFSLKLAFFISFLFIIFPLIINLSNFKFLSEDLYLYILSFNIFFGLSLIGNSLTISLLSLDK